MPGISSHTSQDDRDLELLDSVTGSATACVNISRKLDTLSRTTAACLSSPLSRIISGFYSMSGSYANMENLLQRREPVWSQNVSLSIRFVQERCQQTATELSIILGQHGEWDVLAADGSYHRLSLLSKSLEVQKLHHDLLFRIFNLIPVCFSKPPEHEIAASLFPPAGSKEQFSQSIETARACANNTRVFNAAAGIGVEEEMIGWNMNYASSLIKVQRIIGLMKERLKELPETHIAEELSEGGASLASQSEDFSGLDDCSSTQSTMGIMTPTEDWRDVGSDTTKRGHAPAITRHSLQLCGYATASFLKLAEETYHDMSPGGTLAEERVQRLHKAYADLVVHLLHALDAPVPFQGHPIRSPSEQLEVTSDKLYWCIQNTKRFLERNNAIELTFNQLSGSTPLDVGDIKAMHEAYDVLAHELCDNLVAPVPFQDDCHTSGPAPAPAPAPAPEVFEPVISEEQKVDVHIDTSLQAIIDSMESEPTEEDIIKLVFHWTTLNECNSFKRADVMKLN